MIAEQENEGSQDESDEEEIKNEQDDFYDSNANMGNNLGFLNGGRQGGRAFRKNTKVTKPNAKKKLEIIPTGGFMDPNKEMR
mmetsp:Transcript_10170/g.10142  ORF Transcript_10170/g.10142 Transcript_10170/m.10142 type:complete len:82 (+) Transcript_10170:1801-2046(+)